MINTTDFNNYSNRCHIANANIFVIFVNISSVLNVYSIIKGQSFNIEAFKKGILKYALILFNYN